MNKNVSSSRTDVLLLDGRADRAGRLSFRSRAVATRWLAALCLVLLTATTAAQGTDASDSAAFQDRWLRAIILPGVDEIPHFAGPVAEVTRTDTNNGVVTEARVWRLDERGWPTDTELTLFANNTEYTYTSSWSYGSDGLPSIIEIGGGTHDVLFLSWSESTVEISSALTETRFTYDAARDVLEAEQTLPNEVRRSFTFRPDGSYEYEFSTKDENGEWRPPSTGAADSANVRTAVATTAVTSSLVVSERDDRGNPLAATRARSGTVSGTTELAWTTVYR